jgi:hypothetical protein
MGPDYDIQKFLPAMIARLGAGAAKIGQKGLSGAKKLGETAKIGIESGKKAKERLDEMKESPMGRAMTSLEESAARNKQDTERMEQEARQRMMSGASTGSTTSRY